MSEEGDLRRQLVETGRLVYDRKLAHGTAGNLSARLGDGSVLVTPTNSSLGRLEPDRLSHLSPEGRLLSGDRPSKEGLFHMALYEERPEAGAVVHLHSTCSVALSCMEHGQTRDVLPALTAYQVMRIGRLPLVGYHRPGDAALVDAVRRCAKTAHAMLLANHGPIVSGRTLDQALSAYEELEETARVFFLLGGRRAALLNEAEIADLEAAFPR